MLKVNCLPGIVTNAKRRPLLRSFCWSWMELKKLMAKTGKLRITWFKSWIKLKCKCRSSQSWSKLQQSAPAPNAQEYLLKLNVELMLMGCFCLLQMFIETVMKLSKEKMLALIKLSADASTTANRRPLLKRIAEAEWCCKSLGQKQTLNNCCSDTTDE